MTLGFDKLCPCGESGMDNSPRFEGGRICGSVDLTCFISRECEVIAEFAQRLGKADVQKKYAEIHENLNSLIESKLWNEEMGFYSDFDIITRKPTMVSAVSGFLPLLCGAASKEHAARLAAHVRNPKTYGTFYPLPSVSISDPCFELDMWRGPVWHIFNYHVAEGLDRYGFHDEAAHIRRRTVEAGLRYYKEFGGFFEFYDPFGELPPGHINRKGPNVPEGPVWLHRAVHDYGWSAAVFLDMLYKLTKNGSI
jgi:neutral trehalase